MNILENIGKVNFLKKIYVIHDINRVKEKSYQKMQEKNLTKVKLIYGKEISQRTNNRTLLQSDKGTYKSTSSEFHA
jgi:hypothetical protein